MARTSDKKSRILRYALNVGVVAVLAGVGWVGYSRLFGRKGEVVVHPSVFRKAIAAQEQAAAFRTAPVDPLMGSADVGALVDELVAALPERVPTDALGEYAPAEAVREPLTRVVEYLRARAGDAQSYARWARSQGMRLTTAPLPDATLLPPRMLADAYAFTTGESMPEDIAAGDFFDTLYTTVAQVSAGAMHPVAIATQAPAIEAAFSHVRVFQDMSNVGPAIGVMRTDTLGEDFWVGGSTQFARRIWVPERSLEDLASQRREGAQAAMIRLLVEGASGLRAPMTFVLLYDDVAAAWRIEAIWINNVIADPGGKVVSRDPGLYVF